MRRNMEVNNKEPAGTSANRTKKIGLWILAFIFLVCIGLALIRVLLASGGENVESLHKFSTSPYLLVVRLIAYFLLWQFWGNLLPKFVSNCTPDIVRLTRRPLLVLIVCYELFFATNILGYVI